MREMLANYVYLLPAAICLGGTILFPIIKAIHMSLYYNVLSRPQDYRFTGLKLKKHLRHSITALLARCNARIGRHRSENFLCSEKPGPVGDQGWAVDSA